MSFANHDLSIRFPAATAIGSLPHHNIDSALAYSFQMAVPFLPQVPKYNAWEYMIPQALDGLPGLRVDGDGLTVLDLSVWRGRQHALDETLKAAFSDDGSFKFFEPTTSAMSCWQPFLWELEERRLDIAKVQIAGPLTCQWALQTKTGESITKLPEVGSQILKLILARAIAMTRRLRRQGVTPVLFIDEPGLYALNATKVIGESSLDPGIRLGLQELKFFIQTLQREGALVGIHCCSNTNWSLILPLKMDILSIDSALSLESLLSEREGFRSFVADGGTLSLGIVPTTKDLKALDSSATSALAKKAYLQIAEALDSADLARQLLKRLFLTPACGLALNSIEESELVLEILKESERCFRQFLE